MTSGGWIISHSFSWIEVYVLCCNAQVNIIVIFMTYTCIALHYLFCQLPNCNLFTQHVIYLYGEIPLVNYGPQSILLHSYYRLLFTSIIYFLANKHLLPHPDPFFYIHITVYFLQALFTFLQINIYYHIIRLILCLQQTSEIDNLTASWGKVLWLCCVQVPHCCWRQSYTQTGAIKKILWSRRQSQLASNFRSGFFLLLVD
jgi:hypothetical protein